MKTATLPLLAMLCAVLVLAISAPARVTAQASPCNPEVQTCL